MVVMMRFLGCELRKGCTFIGALWLVFSVLSTMGGPLTVEMFERIKEEESRNFTGTVTPEMEQFVAITMTVLRTSFYGITAIAVVDAVFSIMLIIGAQKDNRALVLPWVVGQVTMMPLWVVAALAFAIMCFTSSHVLIASITISVVVVRIGVTLYSILVVYGLQEYLRRQQEPISLINDM